MCVTEEDEAPMQIMSELRYNFMVCDKLDSDS